MAVKGAIIAIDFDGTVVTHAYPHMGMDAGAVPVLKELVANDCKLILYTMRSGQLLEKAVQWFKEQKIPLYAINENPGRSPGLRRRKSTPTSILTTVHWDVRSALWTA